MKRSLFLFVILALVVLAPVSAITKSQVQDVLHRELYNYFEGDPSVLSVEDMRALLNFYQDMPPVSDVPLEGTTLSATVKEVLQARAIPPATGTGGSSTTGTEEPNEEGLLNGRNNGVYCGDVGDAICRSRYCSPIWNLCAPNLNGMENLRSVGEECSKGHECLTGTCTYGKCKAKKCTFNEQCLSGTCRFYGGWRNSYSACDGDGY